MRKPCFIMYAMKSKNKRLVALLVFLVLIPSGSVRSAGPGPLDLIAEVNAYRQAQGLPALEVDNTLMAIAQNQSDYLASAYGTTAPGASEGHLDASGGDERSRAEAAGYAFGPGVFIDEAWAQGITEKGVSHVVYQ